MTSANSSSLDLYSLLCQTLAQLRNRWPHDWPGLPVVLNACIAKHWPNARPVSRDAVAMLDAQGHVFTTLNAGESFGEQAFLSGGIRGASAQAAGDVVCLKISSEQANQMMAGTSPLLVPVFEALLLQLNMSNALRAGKL